ncbi:Uncharacterized protein Rs2_05992 [Raphanus sativus]|nr:Uncharacterized protein Rs2_05992 [Raphanus sativus]
MCKSHGDACIWPFLRISTVPPLSRHRTRDVRLKVQTEPVNPQGSKEGHSLRATCTVNSHDASRFSREVLALPWKALQFRVFVGQNCLTEDTFCSSQFAFITMLLQSQVVQSSTLFGT